MQQRRLAAGARFAGREDTNLEGLHGFVGDFDSFAEAFVALVDRQAPSQWWHILDTKAGEVVERRHLKVHNGMVGFERSHWVLGHPVRDGAITLPPPATAIEPALSEIDAIEADLRSVLTNGLKNGHTNGRVSGPANGAAADH